MLKQPAVTKCPPTIDSGTHATKLCTKGLQDHNSASTVLLVWVLTSQNELPHKKQHCAPVMSAGKVVACQAPLGDITGIPRHTHTHIHTDTQTHTHTHTHAHTQPLILLHKIQ